MGRDVGKGAGRGVDGTRGRRVDAKGEGGGGRAGAGVRRSGRGGGKTNPSAHVWGEGGGGFSGMTENKTPTRPHLRREICLALGRREQAHVTFT